MNHANKKFIIIMMIFGMLLLSGCDKVRFSTFKTSEGDATTTPVAEMKEKSKNDQTVKKELDVDSTDIEATVDTEGSSNSEITAEYKEDNNSVSIKKTEEVTPTPNAIQPVANKDLTVYTVNVDSGEIETATALIPQGTKITPEMIVETVVESMADKSIEVGIESVTTDGSAVIVSFYKDKAPVADFGSGYEAAILDAIAQSLIDNLKDYNKVIYRVEGKAYESGHIALGIDEVYLGDN